ncbi:arginine--tRNA ligase [Candidatus Woesearchaeota archaeon]|nr:arginine--tRNA ligase [Candidatus Woesearchaeota archaeon]
MDKYRKEIEDLLEKELNKKEIVLEIPKESNLGDYAFPCFILSKELKKSPMIIAQELVQKLTPSEHMQKITANGPYVNFFMNKKSLAKTVVKEIFTKKEDYGKGEEKKERVMIEFSQANTHKAFHVGHVRGTSIGESLVRILHHYGHEVIRVNYQGDTGMHVAKWLWCYLKYHQNDAFDKHTKATWIASVYVDAVKRLSESKDAANKEFEQEVLEINKKLDNKSDKELLKLWKKTRAWSLEEFERIYQDLNTRFDHYFFEGEMDEPAKNIVHRMIEKGIAKIDEGAAIINLEKYNLGIFVLLRKDGTALYSSKDLALAEIKFNKYNIDKSIYVVGAAQTLHLKQAFKTLEIMGFKQGELCRHVAFAEVRLPSGKMSSRTGENILYEDMKQMVFDYTREETLKRHIDWEKDKIEKTVKAISIAAIKFDMLNRDNNKMIVFDVKTACDFEGETGPYLQYANARINSVLKKYGKKAAGDIDVALFNEQEQKLIVLLSRFPLAVEEASLQLKPSIICRYLLDLCQLFNEYYHQTPILKAEHEALVKARTLLCYNIGTVIKKGLDLLGIETPEEM